MNRFLSICVEDRWIVWHMHIQVILQPNNKNKEQENLHPNNKNERDAKQYIYIHSRHLILSKISRRIVQNMGEKLINIKGLDIVHFVSNAEINIGIFLV